MEVRGGGVCDVWLVDEKKPIPPEGGFRRELKWKSLLKSPVVVADSTLSPRRLTSSDQVAAADEPFLPALSGGECELRSEGCCCDTHAAAAPRALSQPAVLPCPALSCPVLSSPVLSACCCPSTSTDKPPAACTRGPPTDSSPLRRSPRHRHVIRVGARCVTALSANARAQKAS